MRFLIALLIGKLVAFIGKFVGRATNMPGDIALKICPDFLSHFKFKGKVCAVTGSNGKTSTANMVAHILSNCNKSVINNAKGSNLTGGVATTLLTGSNLKGNINHDFVILEVDERFSKLIFKHFTPDFLLVTNLFRDQVTRNGNVDIILKILEETINKDVKLILNGNDPISSNMCKENEKVFYGLEKTSLSSEKSFNLTHDAKVCPLCLSKMDYEFFHYNHIGKYSCKNCDVKTPEFKYRGYNVDFNDGTFAINGENVKTSYLSVFHILNMMAAIALCCEIGIDLKEACEKISTFKILKQRYEEFDLKDKKGIMILSKNQNPVSFDQSISYLLEREGEKTVVLYINNINHTNHKDTTWLYDIAFERLKGKVNNIICIGPRAYDAAVRLKFADINMEDVFILKDLSELKEISGKTKGDWYILTELYDANKILGVLKG